MVPVTSTNAVERNHDPAHAPHALVTTGRAGPVGRQARTWSTTASASNTIDTEKCAMTHGGDSP